MFYDLIHSLLQDFKCMCITYCQTPGYGPYVREAEPDLLKNHPTLPVQSAEKSASLNEEQFCWPKPALQCEPPLPLSARDIVLRRCGQTEPLLFAECYPYK